MIQVTGTLTNPVGVALPFKKIRITSEQTGASTVKSTVAVYTTSATGTYDFNLLNGIHKLEILSCNAWKEIGNAIVDDSTPTPVNLTELERYTTPVVVPPTNLPDPTWVDLANSTINAVDSDNQTDRDQVRDGEVYSVDLDEVSVNDRIGSGYAQSSDLTHSHGTEAKVSRSSYSDTNLQEIAAESRELHTSANSILEEYSTSKSNADVQTNTLSKLWSTATSTFDQIIEQSKTVLRFASNAISPTTTFSKERIVSDKYTDSEVATVGSQQAKQEQEVSSTKSQITQEVAKGLLVASEILEANDSVGKSTNVSNGTISASEDIKIENDTSTKEIHVDTFDVGQSTFVVDSLRQTVTINGTLVINGSNLQGAKGDTIFEVYQYSVTGVGGWFDDFFTGAKYRRHNLSINGVVDPASWSGAILFVATDGNAGSTIYWEYAYAPDPITSWHAAPMLDSDVWRRERKVVDNVPEVWSPAARIKGTDGATGLIVKLEQQYSPDGLDNWHENLIAGDHFRRERTATYKDLTDVNPVYGAWTSPVKVVPIKGTDYFDGSDASGGIGHYAIEAYNGIFPDDATATADFLTHVQRLPNLDDHLTFYVGDPDPAASTKRFDGSNWVAPSQIINGDLLVKGTITGDRIVAGTITGNEISVSATINVANTAGINGLDSQSAPHLDGVRFWAGRTESAADSAPFRVYSDGSVEAESVNLQGTINASGTITGGRIEGGTINGSIITGSVIVSSSSFVVNAADTGSGTRFFYIPNRVLSPTHSSTNIYAPSSVQVRFGSVASYNYTGGGTASGSYVGGTVNYYIPIERPYDSTILAGHHTPQEMGQFVVSTQALTAPLPTDSRYLADIHVQRLAGSSWVTIGVESNVEFYNPITYQELWDNTGLVFPYLFNAQTSSGRIACTLPSGITTLTLRTYTTNIRHTSGPRYVNYNYQMRYPTKVMLD